MSQQGSTTALEQAIERYASDPEAIDQVYREFLVAKLLLVTSEDSLAPVMVSVEGQEKQQVWVCTNKEAVPDFAPGTTVVNGYQLLPMLPEVNVHVATSPDAQDVMLIGSRAILHSAPEITDDVRAVGQQQPGTWIGVPDRMYQGQPRDKVPEYAFVGEYWVDESGAVTGQYRPSSKYKPSPLTLGFPEPVSMLEKVLHLHTAGYVSTGALVTVLADSDFALVVEEDGVAPIFPLGGRKVLFGASAVKYVPDFAKGAHKANLASIEPFLDEAGLVLDIATRHQAFIEGSVLKQELEKRRAAGENPQPAAVPEKPIDAHERFLGSMLGGAMGDALGYAIEFSDIGMIRHHHGENGLTEPVLRDGVVQISDDTQMMLFTLEGLVRAHVARRVEPRDNDPIPEVQHAYQRWFHTQNQAWEVAGGPYARQLQRPDGWLITNWALFANRAPGSTCMAALANFAQTGVFATPQHRINNSKGCGGVMRAAPVAAWSNDPSEVFLVAVRTAALTHSHPSGFLSAGVLAVIVHQLIREVPLREAVRLARELLTRWPEHEEQLRVLDRAVALAERGRVSPEELKAELGEGWVGEEALAIGLYAVLAADNLRDALLLSVNHSGDSDSTGIVCGNIGGAVYGTRGIPQEWLQHLELREVIETITRDALAEFSPGPPTDPSWTQRYPAW
ncbi:ADP-ribosylglycohydrolase family protein [Saccharopolyspora karakumensis]|uniref:ADP-ribosylglycohydrolase family protein n=1 Tax=Saccharopolyspora karakumensis TaxID=2530386 RepID=A0A4R5BZ70_9PSEU|nr:ADP-ribosylglycohydrolase family protein [Saccharopolyspora karakumensis]TDD89682.1 ADP-ribosylglycohydrolase family protein [Saccharopolyspora karakumensis]